MAPRCDFHDLTLELAVADLLDGRGELRETDEAIPIWADLAGIPYGEAPP